MDERALEPAGVSSDALQGLREKYPDAADEWLEVRLEDIYDYSGALEEGLREAGQGTAAAEEGKEGDKTARLQRLFSALPSPTSRMDLLSILRTRLIVEVAKSRGCEAVLWGDTTTKLAEKTLAETAKGRGFSLPWVMRDGESPYGTSPLSLSPPCTY